MAHVQRRVWLWGKTQKRVAAEGDNKCLSTSSRGEDEEDSFDLILEW